MRGEAPDKLAGESTISLAYFEFGNALWKESFLFKRISQKEAEKVLGAIFGILEVMDVVMPEGRTEGIAVLDNADNACKFSVTYYDSACVTQALKFKKTLVTDDKKLAKTAEKVGVKTLTSKDIL